MNGTEFGIVVALFVIVAVMGFLAARWQRSGPLGHLNEWGLGGGNSGPGSPGFSLAATCTRPIPSSPYRL